MCFEFRSLSGRILALIACKRVFIIVDHLVCFKSLSRCGRVIALVACMRSISTMLELVSFESQSLCRRIFTLVTNKRLFATVRFEMMTPCVRVLALVTCKRLAATVHYLLCFEVRGFCRRIVAKVTHMRRGFFPCDLECAVWAPKMSWRFGYIGYSWKAFRLNESTCAFWGLPPVCWNIHIECS